MKKVVLATIKEPGTYILENSPRLYEKHQASLANGVVTIKTSNLAFTVRIEDLAIVKRNIHKGQVLGFSVKAPETAHGVTLPENEAPAVATI